jgi:hypothetical protein
MAARLNTAAKERKCSVSKYVVSLITDSLSDSEEHSKKQRLQQLRGALDDPSFEIPNEISWDDEITRRFDLL